MAWTAPRTWVTGEVVTASIMNTHVRDEFNYLHDSPGARVYHTSAQAIATSTNVQLAFGSERYDQGGYHDNVTNNSRLTVPAGNAGRHGIWANVDWEDTATSARRILDILLNGTTIIGRNERHDSGASDLVTHQVTTVWDMADGDYVEVRVRQDGGTSLNIQTVASYTPEFVITRL